MMKIIIMILMVQFCFNSFAEKWQLIKNGKVVNSINANADFVSKLSGFDNIIKDDFAGPGWSYDGATFTPPMPPTKTDVEMQLKLKMDARKTGLETLKIKCGTLSGTVKTMCEHMTRGL